MIFAWEFWLSPKTFLAKKSAVSRTDGNSSSSPSICGMEEFVISHMFIRYIAIADPQSIYVF